LANSEAPQYALRAFFEGKKAGEADARKSGPGTLKWVRQQYLMSQSSPSRMKIAGYFQ
jgi:hypothetical protein